MSDLSNGMYEVWRKRAAARIADDVHRRIIRESRDAQEATAMLDDVIRVLERDKQSVARPPAPEMTT